MLSFFRASLQYPFLFHDIIDNNPMIYLKIDIFENIFDIVFIFKLVLLEIELV